jgi:hypothetical protein
MFDPICWRMYGEGDPECGGDNHLALASCNTSVETRQEEAEMSCLMQSWVVQGYFRIVDGKLRPTSKHYEAALNEVEEEDSDTPEEKPQKSRFRFVDSGNFIVDYGLVSDPPIPPYELTCTGDFNAGKFTTIQVNGTIHRPPPGETWPIDMPWFEE